MNKIPGSFSFGFCLKSNYEQKNGDKAIWEKISMEFFNSAVDVLQTLVVALGAGLGISQGKLSVWGAINLLEERGSPVAISEDGLIEAVFKPSQKFFWALQWHPEFSYRVDTAAKKIFEAFVASMT